MAEKIKKQKNNNQKNFNYYYAIPLAVVAGGVSAYFVKYYNRRADANEGDKVDYGFKALFASAKAAIGYLVEGFNNVYKYIVSLNPWSKNIPDLSKYTSEEAEQATEAVIPDNSDSVATNLNEHLNGLDPQEFSTDYLDSYSERVLYPALIAMEVAVMETIPEGNEGEGNAGVDKEEESAVNEESNSFAEDLYLELNPNIEQTANAMMETIPEGNEGEGNAGVDEEEESAVNEESNSFAQDLYLELNPNIEQTALEPSVNLVFDINSEELELADFVNTQTSLPDNFIVDYADQGQVDQDAEISVCLALIEYSEFYPRNEVLAKLFEDITNNG